MDQLRERLDALEHQLHTLHQQSRAVQWRLRWWRGLACGLAVVGLLGWGLPLGLAREDGSEKGEDRKGLPQRVATLEKLLKHFTRVDNEVVITGANLHIVNGIGSTDCLDEQSSETIPDCPNGLGNLIVGYNEPRRDGNVRTGSHDVVVGEGHNFSSFGGLVVGRFNEISGEFATVSGGGDSTASGFLATVSGGRDNTASGDSATVSGGRGDTASGSFAAVSGGESNMASGISAAVSGGGGNTASVFESSVSGGLRNSAGGEFSSVSGGEDNEANGDISSVSGGRNRTARGEVDWVAGSLFEDE